MSAAILCVGKMKDKAYREMADEYLKRLSRYGKYEEIEIPDLPEPAGNSSAREEQVKTRDGEALLRELKSVAPGAGEIGYVTEAEGKAVIMEGETAGETKGA